MIKKEKVKIAKINKNLDGINVTFSNGLNLNISNEDLDTFTDLGFVNWQEGILFEIRKHGLKKELNPLGTNIYYSI